MVNADINRLVYPIKTIINQTIDLIEHHKLPFNNEFYISTGPLSGMRVNAGPMCLLKFDGIQILVTSRRPIVWPDPELLESMDIKIASIRTLVLKCRSNYRAVYDQYFDSENMIEVDTPGRTSPVLSRHDWKRIPRPSYPLDLDFDWAP